MYKNIASKNSPSLDDVCYLIKFAANEVTEDVGNDVPGEPIKSMCFCAEASAYSSEFYKAGQAGFKPETVLIVDSESYAAQEKVLHNSRCYDIYRNFPRPDGLTELYLKANSDKGDDESWQVQNREI